MYSRLLKNKSLATSRFSRSHLIVFGLLFAVIGSYALYSSFAAGPNIWVSTTGNDTTCVRGDQAKPCLSLNKAYAIATPGDTIQIASGTYTSQTIIKGSQSQAGPVTTFQCVTAHSCIIGDLDLGQNNGSLSGDAPSYLTFDGVDINGSVWSGYNQNTDPQPTHLTFKNGHVWNIQSHGSGFVLSSIDTLTFQDMEVGPICCGGGGSGDDGMEIAVNRPGAPSPSNVTLSRVYIHDLYDSCSHAPAAITNQYGSCSGVGYGDGCTSCDHVDGIQVYGARGFLMENSRIYAVNPGFAVGQGLFMQEANGGTFSNVEIRNNMFAPTPNNDVSMSGPGTGSWSGYLHVYYNTIAGNLRLYGSSGGQIFVAGTPIIVAGNIINSLASSNGNSCTIIDSSGATITPTYSHNLNGNQACGASDIVGSGSFVNSSAATPDYHLSGAQTAINGGESTYCPSTDFDGDIRPQGNVCDIGADEYSSSANQTNCFSSPGSCGYPDPGYHNVGVPVSTTLTNSGSLTITTDGTVINGLNITGSISVEANNVTIQNTKINCGCAGNFAIFQENTVSGLTIKNSEINGGNVGYFGGGTMLSTYMWNCDECVQYASSVTDSYFYIGQAVSGAHYEAYYGGDQTTNIQHDTMFNPHEQTTDVFMNTQGGGGGPCQDHLTINNSLLAGGGFLFYPCGNADSAGSSNTVITNNRFARCITTPLNFYSAWGGTLCNGIGSTAGNGDSVTTPDVNGYFPKGGSFGMTGYSFCGQTTWMNNVWDDNNTVVNCNGSAGGPPDTTPPSVPTGLAKTGATTTSISLSWNASTDTGGAGLAGYRIYRNGTLVTSIGLSLTYTDNNLGAGLTPGTTYSYQLKAYDNASPANDSAPSSAVNMATPANPAPTVSLSATPTSLSSGSASTLTWSSTNATSCTASGSWSGSKATSSSSSTGNLSASSTYTLTCTGGGGSANASASVTVNAVPPPPPAPAPSQKGDCNGDGHVSLIDLSILLSHYNGSYSSADFDSSGAVTLVDLSILLSNYGK